MKKGTKAKQIAVRFDLHSYEKINKYAASEHRGLGEFVRHAVLFYMEYFESQGKDFDKKGGSQP